VALDLVETMRKALVEFEDDATLSR